LQTKVYQVTLSEWMLEPMLLPVALLMSYV
jgi:hypothetical protein